LCIRILKTEIKCVDEQGRIVIFAELGHIHFYKKTYIKAIKNYITSLLLGIKDVDQAPSNTFKRIKKVSSLIILRLSICLSEIKQNVLAALILQLASKTPYKAIFEIFSKIDIKELEQCIKYHKYVHKIHVVELIICEYNKRKLKVNEDHLMRFIESSDIFATSHRHTRKQLKQRIQIEFIVALSKFYEEYINPY